jgi:iron(III) transport system ATP-binding protein
VSDISLEGLVKRFDGKPPSTPVDHLDLHVADGEFLVLLGPSGCGKTTTLRCIAGLETPSEGRIRLGDRTVFDAAGRTNLPPDKRSIGMVFQSYSLWPHMTVRKNIAYPLRARKLKEGLREGWVEETAALVDAQGLLDRYPSQLSGGQQQRIALARGIVARPDVVLFDEPLSNLDARLRDQVRSELHELHGRLGFTAVFVTHDQSEALALADRIAIMRDGRIEQEDTPQVVFEQPATEYVAAFIGMPNRLELVHAGGDWRCGDTPVSATVPLPAATGTAVARLRADDVELAPPGTGRSEGRVVLHGTIADAEYGGRHMDVVVTAAGTRLASRIPTGAADSWARRLAPGTAVEIAFRVDAARWFATDGRAVG